MTKTNKKTKKTKKTTNILVEIKNINNKTRRGDYLKITSKNKPTRLYKINNKIPNQTDIIIKTYTDKYIHKRKTTNPRKVLNAAIYLEKKHEETPTNLRKTRRQLVKYIQLIRRRGGLETKIKTGINTVKINPEQNITNTLQKKIMSKLLDGLVLDKQIKKMLMTTQNFDKLKHRLDYQLESRDTTGKLRSTSTTHNKTIKEALEESHNAPLQRGTKGDYAITEYLKNKGWYTNDKITTTEPHKKWTLRITLRKGT